MSFLFRRMERLSVASFFMNSQALLLAAALAICFFRRCERFHIHKLFGQKGGEPW